MEDESSSLMVALKTSLQLFDDLLFKKSDSNIFYSVA